ncbi:MAG: hypothetical protein FRX48_07024 [Lasallia pustulata]|uniref:Uncharacterized protein n=1 Tax=Lasallia pustulata TaxID=136370 RepID=A0A5M8PKB0_9LECA|nr:MAG: hypothetical protein FRX48_07024 [Lasallia pustulata]
MAPFRTIPCKQTGCSKWVPILSRTRILDPKTNFRFSQLAMPSFTRYTVLAAMLCLGFATSGASAKHVSCYTYTTSAVPSACPPYTGFCLHPDCIVLSMTTVPCVNSNCPVTKTKTVDLPCVTTCQAGCGIDIVTVTSSCSSTTTNTSSS